MSEESPLMALIQKHTVETDLDKHFNKSEVAKNNLGKPSGPKLVLDDTDDSEDAPIGLTYRQPSFSKLHGADIIMKGGEQISNLNEVSELDEENTDKSNIKEEEEVPIGLTMRHSSYASLSLENTIVKGQSKAKKFDTIIPITEIKEEESSLIAHAPINEEEDAEEDDDPTVIMVKQLKAKNTSRWKDMGYEPPKNLIPLVRAASQSQMTVQSIIDNKPPPALSYIAQKLPEQIPTIQEESSPVNKSKEYSKPPTRPRSGSFGMKLGEASESQHLLEKIIVDNPPTPPKMLNEPSLGGIDEEGQEDDKNEEESGQESAQESSDAAKVEEEEEVVEEEEQQDEESSESIPDEYVDDLVEGLYGRLETIVMEEEDSPVISALQNGFVENEEDIPEVRKALQKYLKITKKNNWYDEATFILSILSNIPEPSTPRENEIDQIQQEIQKTFEEKEKVIDELFDLLDSSINAIDDEYLEEAKKLDDHWQDPKTISKYNKPSPDLLNLRSRLHFAIIHSESRDVNLLQKAVRDIEAKETKLKNSQIQNAYYKADQALKDKYVQKRVAVTKKFQEQIESKENEYESKISLLKAQLNYARIGSY